MDEENKSAEETKNMEGSGGTRKPCEDPFPPKLKRWQWIILGFSYFLLILAVLYLIEQLCLIRVFPDLEKNCPCLKEILTQCVCCTYIAFGIVLATLIIDRVFRHKRCVHEKQRVDISIVDAMFVEARTVEPSLGKQIRLTEAHESSRTRWFLHIREY